jgi:endonuclease/exonuclease/phosphatase family metal-dependent hydrolase
VLSGGEPASTFPSDHPDRRIDYVLYQPEDAWRVVEVQVVAEEVASDHRPLLVVLEHAAPLHDPGRR